MVCRERGDVCDRRLDPIFIGPPALAMSAQIEGKTAPPIAQSQAHEIPRVSCQRATMEKEHDLAVAAPVEEVQIQSVIRKHSTRFGRRCIDVANPVTSREPEK